LIFIELEFSKADKEFIFPINFRASFYWLLADEKIISMLEMEIKFNIDNPAQRRIDPLTYNLSRKK